MSRLTFVYNLLTLRASHDEKANVRRNWLIINVTATSFPNCVCSTHVEDLFAIGLSSKQRFSGVDRNQRVPAWIMQDNLREEQVTDFPFVGNPVPDFQSQGRALQEATFHCFQLPTFAKRPFFFFFFFFFTFLSFVFFFVWFLWFVSLFVCLFVFLPTQRDSFFFVFFDSFLYFFFMFT